MPQYPFLRPDFFSALENSGSTAAGTGWQPCHQTLEDNADITAFMPLYVKSHSYGEYVFDWSWANAYHRNGINYYPKLLTAIPFTPATGPRIRFAEGTNHDAATAVLLERTMELARTVDASSWHILFPEEAQLELFRDERLLHRKGVQYHWFNRSYASFDEFLAGFNSRKRKMVRRERQQVAAQGFVIERLTGAAISDEVWRRFALFYQRTYLKRSGSQGYLTPEFFTLIGSAMADQCLMVTATRNDTLVAAAFYFYDDSTLYGRYWGCMQEFDFLHFELCYYQGIEFAIDRGLHKFDAGAQGEHKILRGFEPVITHSLHWIREPVFADAIRRFLREEESYTRQHLEQAKAMLPYKLAAE
jgi:uncharacterized protein